MARVMYPAKHLTPQRIIEMQEAVEAFVRRRCAEITNRPLTDILVRALLPDTDINAGGVAYDQWLTAALVAATEYQFANQQLRRDQVAAIYGVATLDASPGISRVRCLNGTSVVLSAWDTTPLWAAEDTVGYTDEYAWWDGEQTVNVQLMPFLTKAGGERFILIGVIAEPNGTGPVTK